MKNKSLTLDIVIPVYNEQNYLGACLDSIAAQTIKPDSVIVVDNNSTDKTARLARRYPFVELITEKKQGVVFARNAGFNASSADIIGRIDADTHLNPDWVEQTLRIFSAKNPPAAVTGDCYFYDFVLRKSFHHLHKFTYYTIQRLVAGTNILWGSNMALTRKAWNQVSGYTTTEFGTHEDIDLSLQLKKAGLRIDHASYLLAQVSLRRGDLGIKSLNRYLSAWHHTYWVNKMYFRFIVVFLLGFLTLLSAVLFWPFRRFVK